MLFVIVAEALTRMTLRAQDVGLISGFRAHPDSKEILIVQYADDTLIMFDAKAVEIDNVRAVLLWFEALRDFR